MIGKVYKKQGGSGGGEIINGIIEQYKASTSTISANSFVEFVNNEITGTDKNIDSTNDTAVRARVARKIDDNKVFIAYASNSSQAYLTGIVCTINGTTITTGTSTNISNTQYSGNYIKMVTIDTNKVFIAYSLSSGSTPYGIVCTVSGTTISKGSYQILGDGNSKASYMSISKIDANKVFACYGYKSNYYLYGCVCDISGTTITIGSNTAIVNTVNTGYNIDSTCVNDNKVMVIHRSSSASKYIYGIICTISNTSISVGSDTQITTESNSSNIITGDSLIKNGTDKAFLSFQYNSKLYAKICTISNTTINLGTSTNIVDETSSYPSIGLIDTDKVFVSFQRGDNVNTSEFLSRVICEISGNSITASSVDNILTTPTSGEESFLEVIDKGKVIILHKSDNSNRKLNAIIRQISPTIKVSETKIEGLTKEEITTSTAGDVWVLNN